MEMAWLSLVSVLLKTYFLTSRCVVIISDNLVSMQLPPSEIPFVNLCIDLHQETGQFDNLFKYFGCQDFFITGNQTGLLFQAVEKEIKLSKERFLKRKYVLFSKNEEELFDIFHNNEVTFVSDILAIKLDTCTSKNQSKFILMNNNDCVFSLWSHYYVGQKNNQPYILDKWFPNTKSFLNNTYLFPNKLRHQGGRELRIATFKYEPYAIVEMNIAVNFAQHHRMTPVPIINENDYWGEVFENWTGNGLMGNLVMDNADIGAAALYTWNSAYPYLELSKPTVRTGITCLVPAPKLSAGWLTPLYAFSQTTWIAVVSAFFGNVFINILNQTFFFRIKNTRIIPYSSGIIRKAIFLAGKPFILQNITLEDMKTDRLGRCIMGLIFMTSLILSATYQSGFASVMTIPRYDNPIHTVDDLVSSGLKLGAPSIAWMTSIANVEEEKYKQIVSRFKVLSDKELREVSLTENFAFTVERLPRDELAIGNYIQNDVIANYRLMLEDIYWEFCVFMARRNSILLPLLDDFILRVFEAGLISVWQNQAATKYLNQYVQKAVRYLLHKKERTVVKLNIRHVEGAFGILILGNILGIIAFISEISFYKWQNRKEGIFSIKKI